MAMLPRGNSRPVNRSISLSAHLHVQSLLWVIFASVICQYSFQINYNTYSILLCFSVLVKECFDSLLSILHWSWTTLVLGVEELRGLKGFQYTATLLDLERLRFVGTCCLRLLRVYICEIFPIAGEVTLDLANWFQNEYNVGIVCSPCPCMRFLCVHFPPPFQKYASSAD